MAQKGEPFTLDMCDSMALIPYRPAHLSYCFNRLRSANLEKISEARRTLVADLAIF
jgi:hypothetical protein